MADLVFVDRFVPALEAGQYAVEITHTVQHLQRSSPAGPVDPGDPDYIDEAFTSRVSFAVQSERFALAAAEIASTFPPDGSTGEYGDVLPHIVLGRKTLPWDRALGDPGATAPWLCVLVFDESELPAIVAPDALTVAALLRGSGGTLPPDVVSYVDAVSTFALEVGQQPTDPCTAIDVPLALFGELVPTADELAVLTHGRTVATSAKAGGVDGGTSDLAVIVANRLPSPNAVSVAHLVSLEGLAPYLPTCTDGDTYQLPVIAAPGGQPARAVRLVSLASWRFHSLDPKTTFTQLLEALDIGALCTQAKGAGAPLLSQAYALGYRALAHEVRDGSRSVAWYRGPLVPMAPVNGVQVPATGAPLASADQALRYDPTSGMFDVSYAAAWELGRLVALNNTSFSTALYEWKRTVSQRTALAVEAQILAENVGATLDLTQRPVHAGAALIAQHVAPVFATLARPKGKR